jgi:hypothetical protein
LKEQKLEDVDDIDIGCFMPLRPACVGLKNSWKFWPDACQVDKRAVTFLLATLKVKSRI